MHQFIQVGGALFILAAFTAAQFGHLDPHTHRYLALNLAGSSVLTYDAVQGQEWGFFILEFVWAIVSAYGLFQLARGRTPNAAH